MMTLIVILILFLLYLFLLHGRRGNPGLEKLQGWSYAHRGLHKKPGIGENSMTAFRLAVEHGYGAELDVHLLKDGGLAVFHDSDLRRITGEAGDIEDLTTAELKNYRLEASDDTIPTFREVLDLFEGKAPLIVELKTKGNNAPALCQAVSQLLKDYQGDYCIESFDPRCVLWYKKNEPQVVRGQLSCNFLPEKKGAAKAGYFFLTNLLLNFLTKPDFIAYRFKDRNNLSNRICTKLHGLQAVSWTLKSQQEYDTAVAEGALPIFEQFEP